MAKLFLDLSIPIAMQTDYLLLVIRLLAVFKNNLTNLVPVNWYKLIDISKITYFEKRIGGIYC